jgi:hypothetical protein
MVNSTSEKKLIEKIKQICGVDAQKWKRREKVKWCQLGDENSKLFYTMATYRYMKK